MPFLAARGELPRDRVAQLAGKVPAVGAPCRGGARGARVHAPGPALDGAPRARRVGHGAGRRARAGDRRVRGRRRRAAAGGAERVRRLDGGRGVRRGGPARRLADGGARADGGRDVANRRRGRTFGSRRSARSGRQRRRGSGGSRERRSARRWRRRAIPTSRRCSTRSCRSACATSMRAIGAPPRSQRRFRRLRRRSISLDEEAIRARVRARMQLVDEGDYFAVLGVAKRRDRATK